MDDNSSSRLSFWEWFVGKYPVLAGCLEKLIPWSWYRYHMALILACAVTFSCTCRVAFQTAMSERWAWSAGAGTFCFAAHNAAKVAPSWPLLRGARAAFPSWRKAACFRRCIQLPPVWEYRDLARLRFTVCYAVGNAVWRLDGCVRCI